jgi:hypothetical protein
VAEGQPFATPDDYELITASTLSATQRAQVGALLLEISDLMRDNSEDLDGRLAAGTARASVAVGVAVRAVQRYLANPTQASQVTTGPFSRAYAVANARGLGLTDDDLAKLAPVAQPGARGVGSIRLGLTVGTARPPYGPGCRR